jgi:DNA-binding GntR family transcriptional regulator
LAIGASIFTAMLQLVEVEAVGADHQELWCRVRDEIRRLIVLGEFVPGQRLVETALAERFAVSRGPVRVALAELARVGLVTSIARRGMYVATFDRDDLDELFDLNRALERMAAREAAERATPDEISRLDTRLSDVALAQRSGNPVETVVAVLELHRQLVIASHNRRLIRLWNQISEEIVFVIAVTQRAMPQVEWAVYEQPIIDALRSRDPDAAAAAVDECFETAHAEIRALSAEDFARCMSAPAVPNGGAAGATNPGVRRA